MEIKLWVALAVLGVLIPFVVWGVKWSINRITTKLDEIILKLSEFNTEFAKVWGELKNAQEKIATHEKRINAHSDKIREIELKQAKRN